MRVLHVVAGAPGGAADASALEGILALAEAGVEQLVLTRADAEARRARLGAVGVPIIEAPFDKVWRDTTERALKQAAKAFQPDVIHHWMGRSGAFAAKRTRARNLGWHGGYSKLERFRHCAWHAGPSKDIARHVVGQGVSPDLVSVLCVCTPIAPGAPACRSRLASPEDAPVLLALARAGSRRSVEHILAAAQLLPEVQVWIVGEGADSEELLAAPERAPLRERVRLLGPSVDRLALMQACDMVSIPARHEAFDAATIEAWALGKPLLVTEAAGAAAHVTADENALIAPKEDAAAAASAVRRILEDAELSRRLSEAGRRLYRSCYSPSGFVRAAMALYDRIARSAGKAL